MYLLNDCIFTGTRRISFSREEPHKLFSRDAAFCKDASTHLPNASLCTHFNSDCWGPASIVPILKPSNSSIPDKIFRPTAPTSFGLKLPECTVLGRLTSPVSMSTDLLQFAYKTNRSTLDDVVFLVHNITKSLDAYTKSVRLASLDFSSDFDSVPRTLLLCKLIQFGYSKRLLA